MQNSRHASIKLFAVILAALAGFTACGSLKVGIERTVTPVTAEAGLTGLTKQEGALTKPAPIPTPVAPMPGLVYRTADGLWQVTSDGMPTRIFDHTGAQISPDGARALFLDDYAGDRDLWMADLITGERRNLTVTPDRVESDYLWWPARPDVVLFSSLPQEVAPGPGETGFLTAVGVDGTSYRVLDDSHHTGGLPAPSPDGQTIAFGCGGTGWLYHWETGPAAFDPADYGLSGYRNAHIGSPAWSPDGRRLAWIIGGDLTSDGGFLMGVAVFDLETRAAQVLNVHEPVWGDGWPAAPAWSPDGRWLAVVAWAKNTGDEGVWVLPADGQPGAAYHLGGSDPVWSPDGRWLAFSHAVENGDTKAWLAHVSTWKLLQLDLPPAAVVEGWSNLTVAYIATTESARPTPVWTGLASSATPTPTPYMDVWKVYSNPLYAVSMEYPGNWEPISGHSGLDGGIRFAGDSGFFHIYGLDAATIDDAAFGEAEHRSQPYGSQPVIENFNVNGQEARLILPSADQPKGMKYQAALIVRYPRPVEISGSTCRYLLLWADRAHIRTIASTLRFSVVPDPTSIAAPAQPNAGQDLPPGLVYSTYDGLWLVNADGQPQQIIDRAEARIAPRGDRVVFWDSATNDLWLADLVSRDHRNLTNTPAGTECPFCFRWWPARPDLILFGSGYPQGEQGPGRTGFLAVVGVDGTGYRVLDDENHTGGAPAPSPDGQMIAYRSGSTGWLYDWNTGPTVFDPAAHGMNEVNGSLKVGSPAWSPDGSKLAWVVGGDLSEDGGYRQGIGVFDLGAGTAQLLHPYESLEGADWPSAPTWSPDGRWLAFTAWTRDPHTGGVWIVRVDGQGEQEMRLTNELTFGGGPVWSPDGRWLAFSEATATKEPSAWMVEIETGSRKQIGLSERAVINDWLRL